MIFVTLRRVTSNRETNGAENRHDVDKLIERFVEDSAEPRERALKEPKRTR
jgi:hypothetical protein